jgi:peptidoglycan hydrolase-like protein with peptidoglycan-binding domain
LLAPFARLDVATVGDAAGAFVTVEEAKTGRQAADNSGGAAAHLPEEDFVALSPGKTIGRYEIVSVLGQGGFGITYRAHDAQLNREVAIKEYLPTALAVRQDGTTVLPRSTKVAEDFGWGRQRFVDEGRTLASLQHAPAIVQVFDFLEANGTAYIIMRLVPGDTLENRLKKGTLSSAEVDRILWPLLEGLEQVHNTGFLHRDIKPANILLDAAGNPTLIDFGASRAAMAGRSQAMTAIFTPGYAAAEQMTSAKQGPWTDIYGVSATLYHAITGAAPPSAFDRMLADDYEPLSKLAPEGFAPGLLVGVDAGLAVRATDRPQSIAGWRTILGHQGSFDSATTVALGITGDANATIVVRQPTVTPATTTAAVSTADAAVPARKRGAGLWLAIAAVLIALGGGGYWYMTNKAATDQVAAEAAAKEKAAADLKKVQDAQAKADQEKRDADLMRQAEQKAHEQFLAEQAAKEKADADAKAKAAAEAEAKAKADAADKAKAEQAETALHFSTADRQHIQVGLTALGFPTNGTDGVFGQKTRDEIAAWQAKRGDPGTGYLSSVQQQALMRDAAPAITKFDDDQKKADAAAAAAAPSKPAPTAAAATPAPPVAGPTPGHPEDGHWQGTYECGPTSTGAGAFTIPLNFAMHNGSGGWTRNGSGPGNQSLSIAVSGSRVQVVRTYMPPNGKNAGTIMQGVSSARFEGNSITGSGAEANSGGRTCNLILTR